MASGNSLIIWTPASNVPPATVGANFNTRGTPPVLVLEFDAATDWEAYFSGIMPRHYAGGGVTVSIHWIAATATTGDVVWQGAFEADVAQDLDAGGFASANSSSAATTNGTSGVPTVTTIAFTDGAQMDSVAAGGAFRFKLNRDANVAGDTMAGLAQVICVEVKET